MATVPIDLALNVVVGSSVALAGHATADQYKVLRSPALWTLVMFEMLVFLPIGAYLLARFPAWSVMYLFEPAALPFAADGRAQSYDLDVDGERLEIGAVSMGNPHAVLRVDDSERADVARLGAAIESHPRFPQRVNAGFMQVISPEHIRVRVYERGSGETLACGTGACAAVVVGRQRGWLSDKVRVSLRGGDLHISWAGEGEPVMMTGPAVSVYQGQLEL